MVLAEVISFSNFYGNIANDEMNIKLAYKVNKIMRALENDIKFYQEELKKIFDECVEKDENGQYKMTDDKENFIILKDKIEEFEKKFNELRNIEVEFNDSDKIEIELLEDMNITPLELNTIQNFIK